MNRAIGVGVLVFASCASGRTPAPAPPPSPAPVPAAASMPQPPAVAAETPAHAALAAWLDAFNSADEARLKAFAAKYKAPPFVSDIGFRNATGGFDLVRIESDDRLAVRFVVKEKASETTAVGVLTLKEDGAATFTLDAIPPGMTAADMNKPVDAATRTRVIDGIAAKLIELYVFPDVATKMEQALREHAKAGAYDNITDSREFAALLTTQLQAVSHDLHLHVNFSPMVLPVGDPEPSADDKARMREQYERINCGFAKAERLDGGIGYVKFDMFGEVDVCGPKATAALASLGDVKAIIFDLRENGGGQPEMVAFVSSYLFAKRTHLNDIYERKDNKTTKYWTKPNVPGKKFAKQPVYVLTSKQTFSGAEEFSYNLKNLKRATIVGETTGGGAHPTEGVRVDDHFMIGVPFARAINPITKTNWEGTGVEPDVKVPAADALETAKKLAAERIK